MKEQIEDAILKWIETNSYAGTLHIEGLPHTTVDELANEILQIVHASDLAWQVSVDVLAKLKLGHKICQSADSLSVRNPDSLKTYREGYRHGFEGALAILGLLDAVTKPEPTAVVDSSD